jgi:hypothetical protein
MDIKELKSGLSIVLNQFLNDYSFSTFNSQTVPNINYKGGLLFWESLLTDFTPMVCAGLTFCQDGILFYVKDISEKNPKQTNQYPILYSQIVKINVVSDIQFEILDGRSMANFLKIGIIAGGGLILGGLAKIAGIDRKIDKLLPPKKEKVKGYRLTISFEDELGRLNNIVLEIRKNKVEIIENLYKYCTHLKQN